MQDTTKTFDELNLEQLRKAAFDRAAPVGAEFLPPPGPPASAEQIANFELARGRWDDTQKLTFIGDHEAWAKRNPNDELQERVRQTDRMRAEVGQDVAKEMSPDEIRAQFKALDLPERVEAFDKGLAFANASEDQKTIDDYCTKQAVAVLEIGDAKEREEYHQRSNGDDISTARLESDSVKSRSDADAKTGRDGELNSEQQAKLERLMGSTLRETSNEITRDPRDPDGRTM